MNRTPLALTASIAAAALALPATASAHSLTPSCTSDGVLVVTLTNWPSPQLADLTVTVNGTVVRTGAFDAPTLTEPVVIGPYAGTLEVTAAGRVTPEGRTYAARASVTCPTPPPPPPPVVTPPTPPVTLAPVPAPSVVVTTPPPVVVPPKEGGRKKPSRARLIPATSYRVLRAVSCKRLGERTYAIVRIRVVWKRDGRVVKTKTAVIRRPGPVCAPIAVAG